jgi:hypothetical protein
MKPSPKPSRNPPSKQFNQHHGGSMATTSKSKNGSIPVSEMKVKLKVDVDASEVDHAEASIHRLKRAADGVSEVTQRLQHEVRDTQAKSIFNQTSELYAATLGNVRRLATIVKTLDGGDVTIKESTGVGIIGWSAATIANMAEASRLMDRLEKVLLGTVAR